MYSDKHLEISTEISNKPEPPIEQSKSAFEREFDEYSKDQQKEIIKLGLKCYKNMHKTIEDVGLDESIKAKNKEIKKIKDKYENIRKELKEKESEHKKETNEIKKKYKKDTKDLKQEIAEIENDMKEELIKAKKEYEKKKLKETKNARRTLNKQIKKLEDELEERGNGSGSGSGSGSGGGSASASGSASGSGSGSASASASGRGTGSGSAKEKEGIVPFLAIFARAAPAAGPLKRRHGWPSNAGRAFSLAASHLAPCGVLLEAS